MLALHANATRTPNPRTEEHRLVARTHPTTTRESPVNDDPSPEAPPPVSQAKLRRAMDRPLFAGKTWRSSPVPLSLKPEQVRELRQIGNACFAFHQALERLYLKSRADERVLRNADLRVPWVAAYLDAGKPDWLVRHAASPALKGSFPPVLRPDLLLTADGFALTELDSVPGGIGLTAHLEETYFSAGSAMPARFAEALEAAAPGSNDSATGRFLSIVSEEASDYRPEMDWLAETLRAAGLAGQVANPDELDFTSDDVLLRGEKQSIIHRFWELFDHDGVPFMPELAKRVEEGGVVVSPPMRPFQEEKLALALFWHHRLRDYWKENLPKPHLRLLQRLIPHTWIMDPAELPPGAVLDAPVVRGEPISDWLELGAASKRERLYVLKASGYHETAWGARSVTLGEDASSAEWAEAVERALAAYPEPVFVLQEYRKPLRLEHPVYETSEDETEKIVPMAARLRLCPYYFVKGGEAHLSGALATFCPADKKIIHGMKDAALVPCLLPCEG